MNEYKIRIFHKDVVTEKGMFGKIEVKKTYAINVNDVVTNNLKKAKKIIIEVLE